MAGLFVPYDSLGLNRRPPGAATYASSGIFLSGPPDSNEGQYVFGEEHKINVYVRNDSGQPFDGITIQIWVCRPTSNAGPSTVIWQDGVDASGNPWTEPVFFKAAIGRLEPGALGTVSHAWTPGHAELAVAGGHVCLASNVCADGDLGVDGVEYPVLPDLTLPTLTMLHPETDDHHAQRNVTRVLTPTGPAAAAAADIANPGTDAGTFTISLIEQKQLRELQAIDALHLLSDRRFSFVKDGLIHEVPKIPMKALGKVPEDADEAVVIRLNRALMLKQGYRPAFVPRDASGRPLEVKILLPATHQAVNPVLGVDGERAGVATAEIPAGESLPVTPTFEIPEDDEIGSVHVFDLTQSDRDGQVLGGIRILAVTVPEEFASNAKTSPAGRRIGA